MACFTSMLTINACIRLVTSYLGVIQKALRHKKIQTTGCHILRHSFAMNMVEKNTNLGVIQKALRHKKIQTTMIYADATGDMVKKEVRQIEHIKQTMDDVNQTEEAAKI